MSLLLCNLAVNLCEFMVHLYMSCHCTTHGRQSGTPSIASGTGSLYEMQSRGQLAVVSWSSKKPLN